MPDHFHLLLWPRDDGDLSRVMRWHAHHRTAGTGHVDQASQPARWPERSGGRAAKHPAWTALGSGGVAGRGRRSEGLWVITVASVPEPSTATLAGLACVCGIAYSLARRRRG